MSRQKSRKSMFWKWPRPKRSHSFLGFILSHRSLRGSRKEDRQIPAKRKQMSDRTGTSALIMIVEKVVGGCDTKRGERE